MRKNWRTILFLVLLAGITNHSSAQEAKQITCTGKVVDEQNRPVTDAKIELYHLTVSAETFTYTIKLTKQVTTKENGSFTITIPASSDELSAQTMLLAQKEGLAMGWENWLLDKDLDVEIKLGRPKTLAGIVVDENEKPITDAEVGISFMVVPTDTQPRFLMGDMVKELLTTRTDTKGKFSFDNIPTEATAEFMVKKLTRATVSTFNPKNYSGKSLQFSPGQTDIKIIQPLEAKIEGIVVEKESGRPVADIPIMISHDRIQPTFTQKPIISKEDGTFLADALISGKHILRIVSPREKTVDWISEPVEVLIETGQTKSGVKIELSKGGLLEVVVTDSESKQPVEQASISIRSQIGNQSHNSRTDKDGIARIRLMPGEYRIGGIYKQGYSRPRQQEAINIENGKTTRIDYQIVGQPKITGVVRDMTGKPLESVKLKICPMGGRQDLTTNTEGNFEITWDPRQWGSDRDRVFCIVARHLERNLAGVEEISEDTKNLDIKLYPGVIFEGKVVDPDGKGIENARMRVSLRMSNWGSSIEHNDGTTKTDSQGNFQIRAIPPEHKYNIYARAEGYGQTSVDAEAQKAADNPQDIGQMMLPLAYLSISGKIVDAQGNPVANARINTYGENQPSANTHSDAQGNFIIQGVCEGRIYINTDVDRDGTRLSSRVTTDGGASGITIIVREGQTTSYYIRSKTYEQIIQNSDKVIAGVAVDEQGKPVASVPVGIRCIKRLRENGRYSWSFASYQTLSDITDPQGRFVIELEEDAEYSLLFSPETLAATIAYDIPVNTKDLKITLPNGGTVSGRLVRMERGKKVPIPNAEVKIEQTSRASFTHLGFERDRTTTTDSDGRFRFEHIRTKIRPQDSMSEKQWEYIPRIWQISYRGSSKTVAFYNGTTIEDFELVVKPKLTESASLVNSPLPEFDGINIDLTPEQTSGKMVLVCFFDMNQRPSRYCIRQFNSRIKELQTKGLYICAVQAAEVDDDTFNTWVKKSGILFPVGTIQGDTDEIRACWSVHSLPWLILTDKKHIVHAEGFNLSELDEKIQSAEK